MPTPEDDAPLDPELLRELEALRRRLEVRARSRGVGDHVARRRGGAAEFLEHRAYAPFDDLRRVDWAAFARTGEPVLKVYRAEEDVVVRVVCDASASLDFGDPKKIVVARKIAAAIGYLALSRGESAEMYEARAGASESRGASRGRSGALAFVRRAARVSARGTTDLAAAIDALVGRARRPGMLAFVSDFLDGGPLDAALTRAASAGHDVALVHVVAPDEVEPSLRGDVLLEDAETGATLEMTIDERAAAAYQRRFEAHCGALRAAARRVGGSYVRARTDESALDVMRRFVARTLD